MIFDRDVIIRSKLSDIRLPHSCPICGENATRRMVISKTKKDPTRPRTQYYWWSPPPPSTQRISLDVPVCDNHYRTTDQLKQSRGLIGFLAGITAPLSIFFALIIGFNFYDGIMLPFGYYLLFLFFVIAFVWSSRKLGATDVERVVSIMDFVQGNPMIKLRVRRRWYADEILKVNPEAKVIGNDRRQIAP